MAAKKTRPGTKMAMAARPEYNRLEDAARCRLITIEVVFSGDNLDTASDIQDALHEALEVFRQYGAAQVVDSATVQGTFDEVCQTLTERTRYHDLKLIKNS